MITDIDEKDFFQNVTIRICGTLDINKGLNRCFDYLKNFIPLDSLTFFWYGLDYGTIRIVADTDIQKPGIVQTVHKLSDSARKHREKVENLPPTQLYNLEDQDDILLFIGKITGKSGRSALVTRLKKDGKHIGGIAATSYGERPYTKNHSKIFNLVHDPFALALANFKKHEEIMQLQTSLADQKTFLLNELKKKGEDFVGASTGLKKVMELVRQVAPVRVPVLVLGETGVGKEVIATAIHRLSGRKDSPLIKVNCGAIPESLIDSELFGHEKGAFTGAVSRKTGRFERANNGTIFLDEIGEIPMNAQVKLLRVLQNHEIERVGGSRTIPVDIRLVAATHRSIEEMIEKGTFRKDLWFRINGFPIDIPPLRERINDIPALVTYFIKEKCEEFKFFSNPKPDSSEIEKLMNHSFRGNVRELENIVERSLIRSDGKTLHFELPANKKNSPDPTSKSLDNIIKSHISKVLKMTRGKISGPDGAAEKLKINPNTLRNKMKKLGISKTTE
ncbi:MAG: AAA family ATPase [Desulfobacterales bacterium]|nr:AAA family ATPase [Desulfobacterales bacterium]